MVKIAAADLSSIELAAVKWFFPSLNEAVFLLLIPINFKQFGRVLNQPILRGF
jgi:hypothetical protein